jgi:hypothetical protein
VLLKRVVSPLAAALGLVGVVACLAGAYAVWRAGARLDRANERVFAVLDTGLASARDRVRGVRDRVRESRITTARITEGLRDRAGQKVTGRLAAQLEIERRAETLAGHLRTADLWLEASADSVRGVQQVLELGNSVGAPVDPAGLEDVVVLLTSLRGKLLQAEQAVDGIREFTAAGEGESDESRFARVTKLLARILLTIGEVDARLDEAVGRLTEVQAGAQQWKARASRCIVLATVGSYLLLAWIAAGQAALCLCGRKGCRRSRTSADAGGTNAGE